MYYFTLFLARIFQDQNLQGGVCFYTQFTKYNLLPSTNLTQAQMPDVLSYCNQQIDLLIRILGLFDENLKSKFLEIMMPTSQSDRETDVYSSVK